MPCRKKTSNLIQTSLWLSREITFWKYSNYICKVKSLTPGVGRPKGLFSFFNFEMCVCFIMPWRLRKEFRVQEYTFWVTGFFGGSNQIRVTSTITEPQKSPMNEYKVPLFLMSFHSKTNSSVWGTSCKGTSSKSVIRLILTTPKKNSYWFHWTFPYRLLAVPYKWDYLKAKQTPQYILISSVFPTGPQKEF